MSGTKVQIKYGFGKPADGSLKKAELAIDLDDKSLWTANENGVIVRVAHDTTEIEQEIEDNKALANKIINSIAITKKPSSASPKKIKIKVKK